ncbi:MAG: M3 family metallopeptidase [Paludibacter sp.]|jgi:peptidyl-dipeptidase Dcp|nr:M3 family metallopeptidase [Paludibacter sp.]
MKSTIKTILAMTLLAVSSNLVAGNPLLETYNTPHETIPFDKIKNEHFLPAFQEAIRIHNDEILKIANNQQSATFENTIVALENSGALLDRVSSPFYNLTNAETNDELNKIALEVQPMLTEHSNDILLNAKLFERVKAVYNNRGKLKLTNEQAMLLKNTFDSFAENGANLSETDKKTYSELSKRLSTLTLTFGQNALKETNRWSLLITDKAQLAGLSDDITDMLAINAKNAGKTGWLLNLKTTTYVPVMKYAANRDLRRELYIASTTRCTQGEYNNLEIIREIANTRLKIANLLGYKTYADKVMTKRMAESKDNVYRLLNQLLDAYRPAAEKELAEVQNYADTHGAYFKLQAWDWSYYSEKLRTEKFDITDDMLRPYFELENVKKGVFGLATELYGIRFVKNNKIPVYNPEVEAYDVIDEKGKFLAVLYTDFHPRDAKRAGAWMNDFKAQWTDGKTDSRPQITIVMNFTRPTETKPALLTFDEVTTFLHEFGHSLHGMLTKCNYKSLSGTNVYRDFVELPSQLMENWASEKEFLDRFAVHYLTGEKIPAELVKKIKDAENFNAGYLCLRQLSFGLLDMAWHTIGEPYTGDVAQMESAATQSTQILPLVAGSVGETTFNHIFSGGYAAGYYSYKWAEVLDADAFSVFKQNGIFDKKTATLFRQNILERGGTENPMTLYKRFKGSEPDIKPLLERNGIVIQK